MRSNNGTELTDTFKLRIQADQVIQLTFDHARRVAGKSCMCYTFFVFSYLIIHIHIKLIAKQKLLHVYKLSCIVPC